MSKIVIAALAALGCGLIGWGVAVGNNLILGSGLVSFFASYLIPQPRS